MLTIDRRIQFLAYKELRNAIVENQAAGGSIVVMDVNNGEILAMVNLPTYNPNAVTGINSSARRNRAVTDLVEPGSTMKPLTVATALQAGVVTLIRSLIPILVICHWDVLPSAMCRVITVCSMWLV